MAKVDWEQVAKDYEASTLDMAWVTSYAQKAAKLLLWDTRTRSKARWIRE